ncbi:hypothetical protein RJ639_000877 [Escallonia herrerae]|uniref:Cytochrome P450 n=1 Tax=Escallonia herrerae TaxID=1293975 RepID=A0AA88XHT8_9ASTE|nr:hypothetical protein RJ639_000877 [Escallonia herrerae]
MWRWLSPTGDPANVHYILSKNFSNYPKGPEFNKIFDILGDGIFNADKTLWETQRKTTMSLLNHSKFQKSSERTSWNKVKKGLIPILQHATEKRLEVDLQGLFERLNYDSVCILVLGHDPASLSIDLPHIPSEKRLVKPRKPFYTGMFCRKAFGSCKNGLILAKRKS